MMDRVRNNEYNTWWDNAYGYAPPSYGVQWNRETGHTMPVYGGHSNKTMGYSLSTYGQWNRATDHTEQTYGAQWNRATGHSGPNDNAWWNRDNTHAEPDIKAKRLETSKCYEALNIIKCITVRLCLVVGNIVAAWRTVEETGDLWHWTWILICAVLMTAECAIILYKRRGVEWTWWCPCFIIYLATTLPLLWQLQLQQHYSFVEEPENITETGTITPTESSEVDVSFLTFIDNDTWVIVVNEAVIYLIIFARWFLPRGEVSREFLADMLLEYLAISSDIMELLALFDESEIRSDLHLNYWILSVWSISFIQFIPVLLHKRMYRHIKSPHLKCVTNNCGNYFAGVVSTCMSILLQDGPFLSLRLYIIITKALVTYSIVFFSLKNLFSLLLLFYRLFILCHRIPCFCGGKRSSVSTRDDNESDTEVYGNTMGI